MNRAEQLEWLARNVEEWPLHRGQIAEQELKEDTGILVCGNPGPVFLVDCMGKLIGENEWRKKRIELGLEGEGVSDSEWGSLGLPLIGTECEFFKDGFQIWSVGVCIAHGEDCGRKVAVMQGDDCIEFCDESRLKKIGSNKHEKQFISDIEDVCSDIAFTDDELIMIFNAIKAGKVSGVKWDEN